MDRPTLLPLSCIQNKNVSVAWHVPGLHRHNARVRILGKEWLRLFFPSSDNRLYKPHADVLPSVSYRTRQRMRAKKIVCRRIYFYLMLHAVRVPTVWINNSPEPEGEQRIRVISQFTPHSVHTVCTPHTFTPMSWKPEAQVFPENKENPLTDHWSVKKLTNTDNHTVTPDRNVLTWHATVPGNWRNWRKREITNTRKTNTLAQKLSCCEAAILSIDPLGCHLFLSRGQVKRKTATACF